jgi:hypothetical protein
MKKLSLAAVAAVFLLSANHADAVSIPTVITFTGDCLIDCSSTGTGTLTLGGSYTLGSDIGASFISFAYSSSFTSFTILPTDTGFFAGGSLPGTLPGAADISIFNNTTGFQSFTSGFWCVGSRCNSQVNNDAGVNGTFNAAAGVPEPGSLMLLGSGLAGLLYAGRRRKS